MQRSRARAGFTIVELLLSVTFLGLILTGITMFGRQTSKAFQTGTVNADVNAKLRRTMDRIGAELRSSGPEIMTPVLPGGREFVEYTQSVGVSAGNVVQGPEQVIRFELETGELDDGVDNNGNGLVDEGIVVWIENDGLPGERRVVWCHGVRRYLEGETPGNLIDDNGNGVVDEDGLFFEASPSGDVIRVWLSLERMDEDGRTIAQTLETSVKLRNPPASTP